MVVNNPNNWHWVDKNCIDWSRQYFKEALLGLESKGEAATVAISDLTSVEGDVEVCQRKGKVISLFDLKLVLEFIGSTNAATSKTIKGSITIPEVAYDSERDDYQFDVSVHSNPDVDNQTEEQIRALAKSKLIPQLREKLFQFGVDLIKVHGSDIQLPAEQVKSQYTKSNQLQKEKVNTQIFKESTPVSIDGSNSSSRVPKYNTSTLHLEPVFNTSADQLYMTLLDKARVAAWTRAPPNIEPKEGSSFELFGGNISGKIEKLESNKKIVQSWRLATWEKGHYAQLEISFHQGSTETKMEVNFTGIPVGEEDAVQSNFEEYYIRSIKVTFGFGAVL
ncbi:hypothetical protein LJB42_002345 [Komagataella kurtzmanii]|nr:hypothetical protein LJB42_002345 [Komagataella kurtzmanii]